MLICIFHGACRGECVTVAVFLLLIARMCHTKIRVTHVFITRVVPRVTLRVIVSRRRPVIYENETWAIKADQLQTSVAVSPTDWNSNARCVGEVEKWWR